MANIFKKTERTPEEIAALKARRSAIEANPIEGPTDDAIPLGRVMELIQLGHDLRKERERQDITQAQLAEKIGMPEPMISKIEKGKTLNPELETLRRIAEGLGLNLKLNLEKREEISA